MKAVKSLLIFTILAMLILAAIACEDSTSDVTEDEDSNGDQAVTQEESQEIAQEYLLNSPTYLFDGIDGSIELVNTLTARCPSC
ncbi:MAG: hypothetical protein GY845_09180, partial [Planctomycetes bacterium]|nr:hypothetical protein [Planctomycetota bacterium]